MKGSCLLITNHLGCNIFVKFEKLPKININWGTFIMAAKRLTLSCCVTLSPLILCKNESMFGHFTTLCMKGLNVFRSQARN